MSEPLIYEPDLNAARFAVGQANVLNGPPTDPLMSAYLAALNERQKIADRLMLLSGDSQTLRLHMGELSAQELRAVKAVLKWQSAELSSRPALTLPAKPEKG